MTRIVTVAPLPQALEDFFQTVAGYYDAVHVAARQLDALPSLLSLQQAIPNASVRLDLLVFFHLTVQSADIQRDYNTESISPFLPTGLGFAETVCGVWLAALVADQMVLEVWQGHLDGMLNPSGQLHWVAYDWAFGVGSQIVDGIMTRYGPLRNTMIAMLYQGNHERRLIDRHQYLALANRNARYRRMWERRPNP